MPAKNLIGRTFGQWTVIGDSGIRSKDRRVKWICKCVCGETQTITTRGLTSGRSKHCRRCAQRVFSLTRTLPDGTLAVICPDGREFTIDRDALQFVKSYRWHIDSSNHITSNTCGKRVMLSRLIMGLNETTSVQVDHISGDPLDNRRCNLRLCTPLGNSRNRPIRSDNLTGYKGVSFRASEMKYVARISPYPGERMQPPMTGRLFYIMVNLPEQTKCWG
jgi:hypothetical protein